jgi:hypothetical protein
MTERVQKSVFPVFGCLVYHSLSPISGDLDSRLLLGHTVYHTTQLSQHMREDADNLSPRKMFSDYGLGSGVITITIHGHQNDIIGHIVVGIEAQ